MKRAISSAIIIFALFILSPRQYALAQGQNWVDSGYETAVPAARMSGSMSMEAYGVKFGNTQYIKAVEDVFGAMPGITVVYNADPKYVEQINSRSALSGINKYISMIYSNPPASTYAFIQDFGQTLGFIRKPVYAQGIGFSGLSTLLPLWKVFRNISYLLLAIVMVVIGFMIMMRKKIDPKTVVTVQNALPKIIIALLLVTFSYAIVGLVIDLMYVTMFVMGAIIVSASQGTIDQSFSISMISGGFLTVLGKMYATGYNALPEILRLLGYDLSVGIRNGAIGLLVGFVSIPAGVIVGAGVPILLIVILAFAVLFAAVRLFFLLVNAYIQIIISLLTAPIQLMLSALPGSNSFESWLKNLIANVAVFPISFMMIMVAALLNRYETAGSQALWSPPMLAESGTRGLSGLIGLGVLFIIPTIANGLKEAMKAKPAIPAGPGAIFAPITGTVQTAMGTASQFYYGGQILKPVLDKFKKGK